MPVNPFRSPSKIMAMLGSVMLILYWAPLMAPASNPRSQHLLTGAPSTDLLAWVSYICSILSLCLAFTKLQAVFVFAFVLAGALIALLLRL